jgi:hypothetical protein
MLMIERPMASQRLDQARRFRLKIKTASPRARRVLTSGIRTASIEKDITFPYGVRLYECTSGQNGSEPFDSSEI